MKNNNSSQSMKNLIKSKTRPITRLQFSTKNEKFIKALKLCPQNNQQYITYWCNSKNISINGKVDSSLIGTSVDLTEVGVNKVIATGVVEDIVIDRIDSIYKDIKFGGNNKLGLLAGYNLDDWIWEINDTFNSTNTYKADDKIGAIYIRLNSLPINQKNSVQGNQAGRKIR